jgi:inner membrane protein
MPNYEAHVLSGIVSYPLLILIAAFMEFRLHLPLELTGASMALGYALYVFGSDLPDIDHPESLIHRGAKPVVAVLVGTATYLQVAGSLNLGSPWVNIAAEWGIGIVGALAGWYAFTLLMPRHRGVLHSLLAALIYGGLSYLLAYYGINMGIEESAFVGFAAFSGYVLHLILDRSIKLI